MQFSLAATPRRRMSSGHRCGFNRRGLTVIEILVTTAVAMVLVVSVIQAFVVVAEAVTKGRAILEISGQLRTAGFRLREDLDNLTVPVRPWPQPGSGGGYFEYVEGPLKDNSFLTTDFSVGDIDDVLMFTARSDDRPFVGRFGGTTIESRVAEIIWWTHFDTRDDRNANNVWNPGEQMTLHRRVLLVRPDLGVGGNNLAAFYADNDVSVRLQGGQLVANSLGDLTRRESRFAHDSATFPHKLNAGLLRSLVLSGNHDGEDVILSHVLAFDVRAYDPAAPIYRDASGPLVPGDPGYMAAAPAAQIGVGAFVDLRGIGGRSPLGGAPTARSQMNLGTRQDVYCTWSMHYEHDGIDQDNDGVADEATDGIDNPESGFPNGRNGVDDVLERETSPPYPIPLRGISITIRMIERDSQQVRQLTVMTDFTPE